MGDDLSLICRHGLLCQEYVELGIVIDGFEILVERLTDRFIAGSIRSTFLRMLHIYHSDPIKQPS